MNITVQYIIVGAILLGSVIWIAFKLRNKKRGKESSCCGCDLYDACRKKQTGCRPDD